MSENNQQSAQLSKLLNQQKRRLQQMLTTLANELDAIKNRNGTLMVEISEQKQLQLEAIRNADAQFNNEETTQLIESDLELQQLKQELTDLLEQCQTQNEVCYLTATQNQIAVEQVKNLLVGGTKNTTYNDKGQTKSAGTLGKGIKA